MDGLVIGLDLNDDYTQICCYDKEKSWTIPTVICRRKEEEVWLSGEEAYAAMRRSTNGGGENSPMLEGEDDFYELFFAGLED